MSGNFNLLAESLVLAGEELDENIEFEGPNASINNINKCKDQLNYILYECAKSRKELNDIGFLYKRHRDKRKRVKRRRKNFTRIIYFRSI